MSKGQASALLNAEYLISRLQSLAERHKRAGRISHALGVQSAIALIRRDMDSNRVANSSLPSDTDLIQARL